MVLIVIFRATDMFMLCHCVH